MIHQWFNIEEYDWKVEIYYAVDCYYINDIMLALRRIRCSDIDMERAYSNMAKCNLNTGLTFSNFQLKQSVVVIALTSSPEEFYNSIHHEMRHLESHISRAMRLDPDGEDVAYLTGDIAAQTYHIVKDFLCDCKCCKDELQYLIGK